MNRDITVEKFGVRLRPVRLADAEFIVRLRNSPHAAGYIGDSATDVGQQEAWLKKSFERHNDYYFIIERTRDNAAVGTTSIYGIEGRTGEWGRWVITPGVRAAPASMWLSFQIGFDLLDLEDLRAIIVEHNQIMNSILTRVGATRVGLTATPQVIGGRTINLIEFQIPKSVWTETSAHLGSRAQRLEKLL